MTPLRTVGATILLGVLALGAHSASTGPAPSAPLVAPADSSGTEKRTAHAGDAVEDARLANAVLDELAAKYRYLDGVTVSIGDTPGGEQAIAFYTKGRIVISGDHTVGIRKILSHEIWHVIDWRDNGRLDWGENLPPSDSYRYVRQ